MQVNFNANTIDQQINNALQKNGADGPMFQWYLALQFDDITLYHAKKNEMTEDKLPYPGIKFPSAPKVSLYAQEIHYKQYHRQSEALQLSKQPALSIKLTNSMHPHSLHWSKYEQAISTEVFENCPLHTQRAYLLQKAEREAQVIDTSTQDDASLFNQWDKPRQNDSNQSDFNTMPRDFFVDTTLENTEKALKMVL